MKSNAWKEFKQKSVPDLRKEVLERKARLWILKLDLAAGKIKNVKEIKEIKKMIARAETLMNTK